MNKKRLTIICSVLLLAVLAGCGQKPAASPAESGNANAAANNSVPVESTDAQQGAGNTPAESSTVPASDQPSTSEEPTISADAKQTETMKLYYADKDFMELQEATRDISYEASEDNAGKYKAAFEGLQQSGTSDLISLWEKVQLLSVAFADGEVTLDIHLPDEARLGADGELMALDSLQKTMFQFDEVKSIELLVDGKKLETLMGHADLLHPMTRE
ncbi:GerMN domain-containing protein [Paenibacillus physcomitrellae]|nr:GerMN domain-containing protein [Paenibacillus physcomitrellae]